MKKMKMKLILLTSTAFGGAHGTLAYAYPDMSGFTGGVNGKVEFFEDNFDKTKFWYMPTVIDPVANLDGSVSKPVIKDGRYLYFAYSGQPRVNFSEIQAFAAAKGVSVSDISPVHYEKTENAECFSLDVSKVKVQIPKHVGSFLEHVPVTVYTTDPDSIEILKTSFDPDNGQGINCNVDVSIKAASIAYRLAYQINLNDLFTKFQANLHGEAFIFEIDINAALKNYVRDGIIKVQSFEDDTAPPVEISADDPKKSVQAMFNGVFNLVKEQLFVRKTTLPDTALAGRGKAFSFRTDYQQSSERFSFNGILDQGTATLQSSSIQIRVAPLKQ